MAELENIIESFMSSPENMSKIMEVVKMFGGSEKAEEKSESEAEPEETLLSIPQAGLPGGLDPEMLKMIMGLLKDYNDGDDRKIQLLNALRPYLKSEDGAHVDRAIHIAKLAHVAKSAFGNFFK